MRQLYVMAVLVCVIILAGCGSESENKEDLGDHTVTTVTNDSGLSTNDGGDKEEQTNESRAEETEAAAEVKEVEESKAAKDETEVKETVEKEEKEEPKQSKQTQEVKKAIAANKAANTAVGGSIMNKKEQDAPAAKDAGKAGMEKAVKEIRSLAKDLKQKAENGDTEEVKAIAGQIIQAWDAVKSDIKAGVADMYTFLDEKITNLAEQTKAEEIDMEAVIQIDYQIYQGFRQLAEKLGIE
ncbi:hypothetical protein L1N85_09535 [Paenibacillus alkaliterrae]|uniref:hypothetical protein n=1 Tax=Paenibacillus alkaliterrae TaxID=320909 RepID=UPI001F2FD37E|nr:hypothetical protein [Paenibacillus alkaliterrae]MCF2938679.1 hypothetical protein [Paenibacillus alkaliterrae]